jgi:polysaccharide export outer membrane protein
MRKKILIILLLPFISFAQELDQAYLDSLPEDVRKELLEKVDEDKSKEKPIYRKPSTFIEKDDGESLSNKLFGSDFFNSIQSSFMPINEPNLDSNYILDFGDVLQIQLIGQKDSIDEYYIERDGSINVPDIGKLILSGLSLNDASEYIKAKVKNAYIGTDSYISLKFIRDINVLVVGNAYNPGVYTLNGNSNILHALSMAGGINEYGSYRNIQLKRNGKVIETLDIYDLLINGNNNLSSGLRSGDSIVVMPIQKVIYVEYGLFIKAKYELKED